MPIRPQTRDRLALLPRREAALSLQGEMHRRAGGFAAHERQRSRVEWGDAMKCRSLIPGPSPGGRSNCVSSQAILATE